MTELAKKAGDDMTFKVIGDGGRKQKLIQRLQEKGCKNVIVSPPVERDALMSEYAKADVLFLHLNDYEAFKKVLPSKLFEYGATGKPIWAGVGGYAAEFVSKELSNAVVFNPGNVVEAMRVFDTLTLESIERTAFIEKYQRKNIMRSMVKDICELLA